MDSKKTYLNLYVSPEVKKALEKQAKFEGRTLSNLCDRLLSWSARCLVEAGDSQALMAWEPRISKRPKEEK